MVQSLQVQHYCRYVLGMLDKRARTLRCAEVGTGAVMRMEPRAHGYNYGPKAVQDVDGATRREQNKRYSRRQSRFCNPNMGSPVGITVDIGISMEELSLGESCF